MGTPTSDKLQILMANRLRLLCEMLSKILNRPAQVNVIGGVLQLNRLPLIGEMLNPDWVVVMLSKDEELPAVVDYVLENSPDVRILAAAENGEQVLAR